MIEVPAAADWWECESTNNKAAAGVTAYHTDMRGANMRVTTILLAICAAALLGILATVVAVAMRNADAEEAQAARDKEALELEKDRDRRERYDDVMRDARRFLGGSY